MYIQHNLPRLARFKKPDPTKVQYLQSGTPLGHVPDPVCDDVDVVLADGVVAARVVVGRVLLAADHGRGVEEVLVGTCRDLVDDGGLEVDEDGPDGSGG